MPEPSLSFLLLVGAVLVLAGFVKGLLGLGLPTVAIGVLATRISPLQALTIIIVPAIVTNIWQTFAGPYLGDIVKRLWPLMAGVCVGIWLGAGLMTGVYAQYGTLLLGVLLVSYAAIGLGNIRFHVARTHERVVGGGVGLITGFVAAFTGVQVIPSMPFLQAIGMEKDELVQALGVFFTVSTIALSYNLNHAGLLTRATLLPAAVAMGAAFVGMFIGQLVRARLDADAFRRWLLVGILLLGLYLVGSTIERLA
jgi:uncharacterized membrane protein YfcA